MNSNAKTTSKPASKRSKSVSSMNEYDAGVAIHNAIMKGLESAGIDYDSDGQSYWIDFKKGTFYIGIEKCENN